MMDRIRALPVELVYERFMEYATQRQKRLDEIAKAFPDAPEGTYSWPVPTFEQFKGMWAGVLTDLRLTRFWVERLDLEGFRAGVPKSAREMPSDQRRNEAA